MKLPVRIFLALMCAALIVSMPFFLSSPTMLYEAQEMMMEENEEGEEEESLDFGRLFFSSAIAEEAQDAGLDVEEVDLTRDAGLSIPAEWELPLDFSVPPSPDPDHFTEDGYEDESIRVRVEMREMKGTDVHIAFVEIASASQLRTSTWKGIKSSHTGKISTMAKAVNAVIAINGDYFSQDPGNKAFEIRMTQTVTAGKKRNKILRSFDTLIIDQEGNFHIGLNRDESEKIRDKYEGKIVNAFTFGPGLVVDGVIPEMDTHYFYNPNGREPRSAIGQTGPLSYVLVVVAGRGKNGDNGGVNHQELAEIMLELGCTQAYNLDGGNSAEMIMYGPEPDQVKFHFKGQITGKEREQSDIIYFATAVPVEERK